VTTDAGTPVRLRPREAGWVLRRCSRRGHVVAVVDDDLAPVLVADTPAGELDRCLRCGCFVRLADPAVMGATLIGRRDRPVPLADVPLVLRGSHGRKLALLRVLAVERGGRGVILLLLALGIAQLATSHVALAEWLGRLTEAARPLGDQIGWNVAQSSLVREAVDLLGHASGTYTTIAWLVGAYGAVQVTEGIGLWAGRRWAEYLAVIATTAFVPLEIYELYHHATIWKALALAINLVAVGYLVVKGRLFGVRGGHPAYLAEVRDATLLADLLRAANRPTSALASHTML
jgi:uncharacterized membrane protein (DUF2068 family)